jgi:fumarate reductase flavoprotein subunit
MYDAIVIGGGGSGLAAAASAAERGLRVLVVEKRPQLGGTTGIAVGSFTAAGTRLQKARDLSDNPRDHAADAARFAPPEIEARNHAALRQFFLAHAADTFAWLETLGVAFHGPSPEPPNRVPRMHNVVPNAKAYIAALQARLLRLGGEVWCDAAVERILQADGRATGIVVRTHDGPREVTAARGIVLATGDYAGNAELIARFKGHDFRSIEGINPYATGDGHALAESLGARLVNMDVTYGPELRFVPPAREPFAQLLPAGGWLARGAGAALPWIPKRLVARMAKRLLVTWQHPENALFDDGAILVNQNGRRFCNETKFPDREIAVSRQPGKLAYLVADERLAAKYGSWPHFVSTAPEIAYAYVDDYLRLRPDVTVAGSLEAVASTRGLPLEALRATLDDVNRLARDQAADPFGRANLRELDGQRFVLFGPLKAYFTTTEGGAAIDERFRVLDNDGRPIPGLYAVGQVGLGGQILWGHGLHIAWAITSGRLVGEVLASSNRGP